MEAKATLLRKLICATSRMRGGEGSVGHLWVRTQVPEGAQGWMLGSGSRLSSGTNDCVTLGKSPDPLGTRFLSLRRVL